MNLDYFLFDINFTMNNINLKEKLYKYKVKILKEDKMDSLIEKVGKNPDEFLIVIDNFIIPNVIFFINYKKRFLVFMI
jgi:hypothetical protein